ncbi:hypothetical protein [Bacillus sp. PS06]|uniref:hypothetical protein n=1 Tax=Bacillus sp. PS06 TaxID=2764176 RepID=UPI00178001EC|nr:hypothetical protein [Bacillus sp. PS06]MBD8071138.1 hypothetical protein [Bacillus sp. PS06]
MRKRNRKKFAVMLMLSFMLFMHLFPLVGFASFIKPGMPMVPGKVLTPGDPISGGKFIIPGAVYDPGTPLEAGEFGASGQLIFPSVPTLTGSFIIPNAPPAIPSIRYAEINLQPGNAIEAGTPVQAGDAANGGDGPSGGQAVEGGDGPSGGQAVEGGEGPNGGQAVEGGEGPNGGQAVEGGEGPNGGQAVEGGEGPNGGQAAEGGEGPNGGQAVEGGEGPNGGQAAEGGEGPNGGQAVEGGEGPNGGQAAEGGEGPNGGQAAEGGNGPNGGQTPTGGNGQGGEATEGGLANTILNFGSNAKKWLITYPKTAGDFLDGTLSMIAGFQIKDLKTATGNKNLMQIMGDKKFTNSTNPIAKWLNSRYQNYLEGFKQNKLILKGRQITETVVDSAGNTVRQNSIFKDLRSGDVVKQKRLMPFLTENFGPKTIASAVGKSFNENWNFANKTFWKPSNMAKGSGIVNVLLSTGERIIEYATDSKKSFASTNFAAGITTDVMAGLATTAISAGAGWMATAGTAAAIGSVVPGIGTVVGAVVGVGVGLFLASETGQKIKGAVESGVKKLYDGVASKFSSAKKKFTSLFGS